MATQGVVTLPIHSAPQFARLVKRPRDDLVPATFSAGDDGTASPTFPAVATSPFHHCHITRVEKYPHLPPFLGYSYGRHETE